MEKIDHYNISSLKLGRIVTIPMESGKKNISEGYTLKVFGRADLRAGKGTGLPARRGCWVVQLHPRPLLSQYKTRIFYSPLTLGLVSRMG